ncbi:MAG: ATP-dependent DNA helicase RecG, partial [Anaerolineales bacterium]|nr:ATP-dependent DNA helicase RecG [Anaerolineales bacterium]
MARSFKRLKQVLSLEEKQGYQNKAVVGGIRQFANFWVSQAREEAVDEADRALVEQIAEMLVDYGRLPGREARSKAIDSLMTHLQRREERLGPLAAPKSNKKRLPAQQPKPKPAQAPKSESPPQDTYQDKGQEPDSAPPLPDTPRRRSKWDKPPQITIEKSDPDPEGLSQSVTILKGVGPKVAQLVAKIGAQSIWDLLYIFPRRYDDYTLMKPIHQLKYGDQVTIIGTIWETRARQSRTNQVIVQSIISDGTAKIQATWFNQRWLADKLKAGMQVVISGKVDQYLGRLVFNSPEWEPLEMEPLRTRRIVPIYPLTQGLNSNRLRDIMRTAVQQWACRVPDAIPPDIRQRNRLYNLPQALQQLHFPESQETLHHARRRIVFDELFLLQLGMQSQRREWQSQPALAIDANEAETIRFQNALPFELTNAQKRVIEEIRTDLNQPTPMNRLLQGDVGSGKTVVAAAALLMAAKTGYQAALMAPTEILAEQHFQSLSKLLQPLGVELRLLTGSTSATEKAQTYTDLETGAVDIVIGTHALIQEGVTFNRLALAVIDEQHRFGVDQRQALRDKGIQQTDGVPQTPHVLVMSATPIPRTLALSLYGDLDLSVLDEMPPGRQEIKTKWLQTRERERAYGFIRSQVEQGRQAYIIYPLVEESDKIDAKAAVEEFERLQTEIFPDLKLGLIHGRLKSDEKEASMRAFYSGETHVLVSTSVIEVGVDVPNSTVMLVDGANRFGLAQLHQFRGRVGRGEHQSYCLLIADGETAVAEERLTALEQTNDGFVLAEK